MTPDSQSNCGTDSTLLPPAPDDDCASTVGGPAGLCCVQNSDLGTSGGSTGGGNTGTGVCYGRTSGYQGICKVSQNCDPANSESGDSCGSGTVCCVVKGASAGSGTSAGTASGTTGSPYGSGAGTETGTTSATCDGVVRSGICFPTNTGLAGLNLGVSPVGTLLMRFMNWLLAIFGMIAIIAFVISGMQYLISAGDEGMVETAKNNMKYSIIGVLIGLSGWIIITAIDQALGGSSFLSVIIGF